MSQEQVRDAVEPCAVEFEWERSLVLKWHIVQWQAEYQGQQYIVWLDPEEHDPNFLFFADTEPSASAPYAHPYATPAAARAACVRHFQTGKWD